MSEREYRTLSGRILNEADIGRLADEAEEGYPAASFAETNAPDGGKRFEEVYDIIKRVEFPGKQYKLGILGDGYYIQIEYMEADVLTGEPERQGGRKFYVSRFATESEIVQTCLTAALASAEHQVREHFRYRPKDEEKSKAIYGPHFSASALWGICGKRENFDARPGAVEQG